jgi:hypothetical protein
VVRGRGHAWGLPWAQEAVSMANKIANLLNDSGHAKMMVQQYQLEVYSREKQIVVKVPTRFASNHLVIKSISDSKQALIQAVVWEAWSVASGPGGNPDGIGAKVKAFIDRSHPDAQYFWENLEMLMELLRPFSDAIHQLRADRPMLGQCHVVLLSLHEHVHNFAAKYEDLQDGSVVARLMETFQRRCDAEGGGAGAPIYNVAYSAAFLLDPYNAIRDDTGVWRMPAVEGELKRKAVAPVQRMAGPEAAEQMRTLRLDGYTPNMGDFVAVPSNAKVKEAALAAAQPDPNSKSKKRKFVAMPPMNRRISIWEQYGCEDYPDLMKAVIRLLSCHARCAVERNWTLRINCTAHNALGMEHAKKMVAICTNSRAQKESDFAISLSVVEGDY